MATSDTKAASLAQLGAPIVGARDDGRPAPPDVAIARVSSEEAFHTLLTLERRRAERSRRPFFLMLLDAQHENRAARTVLQQAATVLVSSIRETDCAGWYKTGATLGAIFTEIGDGARDSVANALRTKISNDLHRELGPEAATKIVISLHVFPEEWDHNDADWTANLRLYPELKTEAPHKRVARAIKRSMDIVGSGALLLLLSPILAAIAVIIKLTSKGPVLYGQERMGQHGARFTCLKFRSMYLNNAPTIHQEFVQKFIAGGKEKSEASENGAEAVYKITNDPRVTPTGRFLRKTSLDELPQFWNVLVGQMSLVGPRPPVPYEFEVYEHWHRRRVLEVQPGITGLWQVNGRSRTTFDQMVRLDLRYCKSWSLWLDIKILLATPKAVLFGSGAY